MEVNRKVKVGTRHPVFGEGAQLADCVVGIANELAAEGHLVALAEAGECCAFIALLRESDVPDAGRQMGKLCAWVELSVVVSQTLIRRQQAADANGQRDPSFRVPEESVADTRRYTGLCTYFRASRE